MKIAVSSYVLTQATLFVAWLIGVFNVSVLLALLPTFIALSILAFVFALLKTLDYVLGLEENDEPAEFSEQCECLNEEKEDTLNGQNQNQEGCNT